MDYSDGSCASLLLEPQRTNLITYSEDFSQSYWGKLGLGVASAPSVTSNTSISPSGEQNASRVIFDLNGGTSASDRSIIRVSESTSSARVFSIYIKSFDGTDQQISLHIGSELALFTVTSEWKRYTFSISSGVTFIGFGLKGTNGVDVSDVLFYGAQLEVGSYPTSYIPSNSGSQTTRSADVCNNAGTTATFNSTEGVLFAEIAALYDDLTTNRGIAISDGTSSNRVLIYYSNDSNQINAIYTYNGTTQVNITKVLSDSTQFTKFAFKYKENDCAFWIDGIEVGTDNTATAFAADTLDTLNFDSGSGGSDFYGKTKQLMTFNEALSDEELSDLTGQVNLSFNNLATFYNYTIL